MLKLKTNLKFENCNCNIYNVDITNFSIDNGIDGGFIPENNILQSNKDYHLSDGVLITLIYISNYNNNCVSLLSEQNIPFIIPTDLIDPLYENNLKPTINKIKKDGLINIDYCFIISKTFYEQHKDISNWFNKNNPIIYFNPDTGYYHYILDDYEETITNDLVLVNSIINNTELQGIVRTHNTFFNICNIQNCYISKLEKELNNKLGFDSKTGNCRRNNCNEYEDNNLQLIQDTLQILNYLIDCGEYSEASRLLNLINRCGNLCENHYEYDRTNTRDCGCS